MCLTDSHQASSLYATLLRADAQVSLNTLDKCLGKIPFSPVSHLIPSLGVQLNPCLHSPNQLASQG